MKILVTGGAGFIGSHIVDQLVQKGHETLVLDNLEPQVHKSKPDYLNPKARYIFEDILDANLSKLLEGVEVVFHEAAMVGVGQSMYQVNRYMQVNTMGTSRLIEHLINSKHSVKKLVVASSMSTYGEGLYKCESCGTASPSLRPDSQLKERKWEQPCPSCGKEMQPIPTPETKQQEPASVYALSKYDQEILCLVAGKAFGIPTVALRYFNVYGPRQSLNNPYTGVAAIFSSRIKNMNRPIVFEDGAQSRDFVSVHDIAAANLFVMSSPSANYKSFNVGTGKPVSIRQVAQLLAKLYHKPGLSPEVTNKFRSGDIRHCFADTSKLASLGFEARTTFDDGMAALVAWGEGQQAEDLSDKATQELIERGLVEK